MKKFENESQKHQKLLELYQKVLKALMIEVDDDGICYGDARLGLARKPVEIPIGKESMQLVLPTKPNLGKNNVVVFHPLHEAVGQESVVHAFMRRALGDKINIALRFAMKSILAKLNDTTFQQHMTADQQAFIMLLGKTGESDIAQFDKFLRQMTRPQSSSLIELAVKTREGGKKNELNGTTYSRIATVIPNILTDVTDLPKEKMSKRAKECVIAIVEAILPGINESDPYASGSNSTTAPHSSALLETANKLMTDLKQFERLFPGSIDISMFDGPDGESPDESGLALLDGFSEAFMEEIRNIDLPATNAIIRSIPQQRYNKPEAASKKEQPAPATNAREPIQLSQPPQVQPAAQSAPAPVVQALAPVHVQPPAVQQQMVSTLDLFSGSGNAPQIVVPVSPQQPQQFQQPVMFGQQQFQQPMMQAPMMVQQPQQFMQQPMMMQQLQQFMQPALFGQQQFVQPSGFIPGTPVVL